MLCNLNLSRFARQLIAAAPITTNGMICPSVSTALQRTVQTSPDADLPMRRHERRAGVLNVVTRRPTNEKDF
jgi:hypothetical protein